ncbi:MAG: ATP-binding cassette domain-containing protein [Candidatus Omnitrophica bacterium]|nr:ATP-binding cassette domain-containing protein [Candidatus Omnitrophota bacterium]
MIAISKLSKDYGKRSLFENISLNINAGERIGLLGPNGAGKSTLFAMILGEIEPSDGEIRMNKNIRIGHLPQECGFHSQRTVMEELLEGDSEINRLNKEKDELEKEGSADSMRYGDILERLEILGYFQLEYKAKKILTGLEFKEDDFCRPVKQLSGGWQMRVLLAKLLTCPYDILLLDEPTNYLDLNAAVWLKDYLSDFKGSFIMISHDKAFLTEVTNYTLILDNGSIFKVKGSYEHYEQIKEERRKFLVKQFKDQEKKREQLERFVSRFHAQPNKAASVRAKRTALERLKESAVGLLPNSRASIGDFRFPGTKRSGHKVITLEGISKSYGDITVYEDFDFEVYQREKAVLAGDNGAGKSTLLKIMAGVVDIDKGRRIVGHKVDIGYFSQTRLDVLNPENTVLAEAYSAAPGYMAETAVRTILGALLFSGDDSEKKVKVLSGGEKSRLILVKLLIDPPNFLLLDEPTTHLDVDAVDALTNALRQYEGTIVFISHDIYFVRRVANVVFDVQSGKVRKIAGEFDYYLEKKAKGELLSENSHGFGYRKPNHCSSTYRAIRKEREEPKKEDTDKLRLKEEKKRRIKEEKRRRAHNAATGGKIDKLKHEKENLRLEMYSKSRSLSDPRIYRRRDEETAKEYGRRIKEIEKLIVQIDEEIETLKSGLLPVTGFN